MKKNDDNIYLACIEGNSRLLKQAISSGGNINKRYYMQKPLAWAIQEGHLSLVKILVANGANLEERNAGFTYLDQAVGEGHLNIIRYLLSRFVDVNAKTNNGSALHTACAYGKLEIANLLIGNRADYNKKDEEGKTPLFFARKYGHTDIVDLIDKLNKEFCCFLMCYRVFESFDKKGNILYDEVDVVINKWKDGTYGIPVHDGGASVIGIKFCPWCGKRLSRKKTDTQFIQRILSFRIPNPNYP